MFFGDHNMVVIAFRPEDSDDSLLKILRNEFYHAINFARNLEIKSSSA